MMKHMILAASLATAVLGAPASAAVLRGFDGELQNIQLASNRNLKNFSGCRTLSYVAKEGDVAMISISVTASADGDVDYLFAHPTVSVDGAAMTDALAYYSAAPFASGVAHVSSHKRVPLVAGKSYIFGAGLATENQPRVAQIVWCQGTVTIFRNGK